MSIHNFSAGPAAIPQSVLEQLQAELCDFDAHGYSLLSTSHRSTAYENIHTRAINGIRAVLQVPETHSILLLGGGASLQFGMVPMNFAAGEPVGIALSGKWAAKAFSDLARVAKPHVVWQRNADEAFPHSLACDSTLRYVHITTNETIDGVQWQELPDCGETRLVLDASSDLGSRNLDIARCGLVYAGTQKNLGIAGLTIVIVKNDMFDAIPENIPAYLSYETHRKSNSLYNTPPVFAVRALDLVLQWVEAQGGVARLGAENYSKSQMLYDALDAYPEIYASVEHNRSRVNIVWTMDRAEEFLARAAEKGFIGLKGHRSLGGVRASLYNAVAPASAELLAEFIRSFAKEYS